MKWINTNDLLPKPLVDVLVVVSGVGVPWSDQGFLDHSGIWRYSGGLDHVCSTVTHWMPMPDPPGGNE